MNTIKERTTTGITDAIGFIEITYPETAKEFKKIHKR